VRVTHPSLEWLLFLTAILMIAATFAGSLTSRFGLPALIGFLGLGMIAGVDGLGVRFDDYAVSKDVGVVALILILFSGGMETPWRIVRSVLAPATLLATFGVLISATATAALTVLMFHKSFAEGALIGAIVSATDAAAVFAVIKASGVALRRDVRALIEVESGSNDPTAAFLVLAATALLSKSGGGLGGGLIALAPEFFIETGVGLLTGVVIGGGLVFAMRRGHLATVGLAGVLATLAALLAYGGASLLHGNGFFAAYAGGVTAGSLAFKHKRSVLQFQDGVAWLAQVTMFLTLGLLVNPRELPGVAVQGVATTLVLMVLARPLSVFLCLAPFRRFGWRAKAFVSWGGLRGAAPIVLSIFPMIAHVPGAEEVFDVVFFVVLLASLIQGPTLGWAARRLRVDVVEPDRAV
jgi:cell volume regulation protein A